MWAGWVILLTATCSPGAVDPCLAVTRPSGRATTGELLRSLSTAWGVPYVLTAGAEEAAKQPLPGTTQGSMPARAWVEVLETYAGLRPWITQDLVVWFNTEGLPGLIAGESRKMEEAACPGSLGPDTNARQAAVDMVDVSAAAAIAGLARAYDVAVVYAPACERSQELFTLQGSAVRMEDALARLKTDLGCTARLGTAAIMLEMPAPHSPGGSNQPPEPALGPAAGPTIMGREVALRNLPGLLGRAAAAGLLTGERGQEPVDFRGRVDEVDEALRLRNLELAPEPADDRGGAQPPEAAAENPGR